MIISRTPFRISFFGGGTDYPSWYQQHKGAVLATTIDKYCYIVCRYLPPFFESKIGLVYSKLEHCNTVDEIQHPAVRETLKYLNFNRGIKITHDGDLPARSGMGSSSAFTVGLLHAVYALMGRMPTKHELAMQGIHIEQNCVRETVGSQDQIMAAYGGFNHVVFHRHGDITVNPMILPRERLQELNAHLMLFYTGIKRTASNVAESYVNNLEAKRRQLRIMRDLVKEGISVLSTGQNITAFGELLAEAWNAKRSLSSIVSNSKVDEIFAAAKQAGAVGGKLTGAGGGGFLLLFVPPSRQERVKSVLKHMIHVPFSFEFTGSQVIFMDREIDYSVEEESRDYNNNHFTELLLDKEQYVAA